MAPRHVVSALVLLGSIASAHTVAAADAQNGLVIAKRWCAECHLVSLDQKSAKSDVPSFADIAERGTAGSPAVGLQRFLMNPHPRMPDMQIGRREADDLVAYIATLKK